VTAILNDVGLGPDLSGVPTALLEAARRRGTAVHQAIEAIQYGFFDEAEVPEDVIPRLAAYRRFLKDSGYETVHTEITVTHPAWRYIGHPDTVGWLNARRVVLDWKNTDVVQLAPASYQLAAYRAAFNAEHPTEPVEACAVVQLKGDGTYRVWEVDIAAAEPIWFAAVTVYRARQESPHECHPRAHRRAGRR
jgi:hypothetical protein